MTLISRWKKPQINVVFILGCLIRLSLTDKNILLIFINLIIDVEIRRREDLSNVKLVLITWRIHRSDLLRLRMIRVICSSLDGLYSILEAQADHLLLGNSYRSISLSFLPDNCHFFAFDLILSRVHIPHEHTIVHVATKWPLLHVSRLILELHKVRLIQVRSVQTCYDTRPLLLNDLRLVQFVDLCSFILNIDLFWDFRLISKLVQGALPDFNLFSFRFIFGRKLILLIGRSWNLDL